MQATHPRLHLRDAHDAHVIFEAVRQGFLFPIRRRLNEIERNSLVCSGAVFVWFEGEDDSVWEDGRSWGQARMREPYLYYDEKIPDHDTNSERNRFADGGPISHQDRTAYHHPGLVKQVYSSWVSFSPDSRQKWHIIAYFTYADLPSLPTISDDGVLPKNRLFDGICTSRTRRDQDNVHDDAGNGNFSFIPNPLSSLAAHPRPPLPHTPRLPEDQRVIHILNSRHVR